jgi:polar amino acid transport system permease protein
MQDFLEAFLNWEIMREASPILWQGLRATLLLSLVVVPLGLLGGIILAVLSTLPYVWVRWPLRIWVDTFRALPPLVAASGGTMPAIQCMTCRCVCA